MPQLWRREIKRPAYRSSYPKTFSERKGKSDFNSQITSYSINILAKQRLYMREYTLHVNIHTVTQLQILSCHQDLNDMRWEGGLHPAHRLASSEVIKEKKHFTGKKETAEPCSSRASLKNWPTIISLLCIHLGGDPILSCLSLTGGQGSSFPLPCCFFPRCCCWR